MTAEQMQEFMLDWMQNIIHLYESLLRGLYSRVLLQTFTQHRTTQEMIIHQ